MARQPEVRDVAPVVQRLRVRYAKRGRLRFTSHRDFQRALERALRRADLPIAYSAGFSPHPRISYVGAAPTGTASEAEYIEIAVSRWCDPEQTRLVLDASLPPGLDLVEMVEARGGSLPDRINASHWQIKLIGVDPADARRAVEAFLAAETVPVERLMKDGKRILDAREPVVQLGVIDGVVDGSVETGAASSGVVDDGEASRCAILELVVRHVTPAVRPDDVLVGLRQVSDLAPPQPPLATRLAQGLIDEIGQLADPLGPDRAAAVTDVGIPASR